MWAQNGAPADAAKPEVDPHKMVQLNGIEVTGTRLPPGSIARISGLKTGQMVNYDIINEACHRITATGLASTVDYAYNLDTTKGGMVLSLTVTDETPLYPAKIIPQEDAEQLWSCLEAADPIFTRKLPNTANALGFYATNMNRCLENAGERREYVRPTVSCDLKGKAAEVLFLVKPKEGPQKTERSSR